ncbi:nucleolar 58-like [Olea europaea subsp. europaea]|uniref:Nucleolar 58-like n=1 Tax=Olea europaea subsp. europaea TaxID=158383 RepID=A0A8S0QZ03_OLEEU|nr:nucleolar 58-like [Olea europaea subsp. europaea]
MESESEDDILDEGDDEMEEEHDHEPVVEEHPEPVVKKSVDASPANKEVDKQISKKERRKKELAELEAILAEIGVAPKEKAIDESSDISREKKEGQMNGDVENKDNVHAESKSSKKKKKKDKASKEVKESQDQSSSLDVLNGQEETTETEQVKHDASAVNVKDRLKKAASAKKKKSNKEMDAAAKAAAVEAAARSAKLAAAKKKEKNHYNQQPLR